jgi:hypothetical protein
VAAFFFVLCSDILFYGEEISGGLLKQGQTKRYKFHREFFLDELMVIINHNESKSFVVRGLEKAFEVEAATAAECSLWIDDLIRLKSVKRLNLHPNAPVLTKEHPMGNIFRVWQEGAGGGMVLRTYSIPQEAVAGGVVMLCDLHVQESDSLLDGDRGRGGVDAEHVLTVGERKSGVFSRRYTTVDSSHLSAGRCDSGSRSASMSSLKKGVLSQEEDFSQLRSSEAHKSATTAAVDALLLEDSPVQSLMYRRHSTPASVFAAAATVAQTSQHPPLEALHNDLYDVFGNDILTPTQPAAQHL